MVGSRCSLHPGLAKGLRQGSAGLPAAHQSQPWGGLGSEESEPECVERHHPDRVCSFVTGNFFLAGDGGEVCKERAGFVHLT